MLVKFQGPFEPTWLNLIIMISYIQAWLCILVYVWQDLVLIGSDNDLARERRQAITSTPLSYHYMGCEIKWNLN